MPQLRIALFAYRNRDLLARVLLWSVVFAVAIPLGLALLAVSVFAGPLSPGSPGAPVKPMPAWEVTQRFGCTGFYFEPRLGSCDHFHSGIDLAAASGTPVSAVLAGTVEVLQASGAAGGYGLHVVVTHAGGLTTLYGHLAAVSVQGGQVVQAGELIGYEGSTGLSTGPHLHFEVRRADVAVDPEVAFPTLFSTSTPKPVQQAQGTVPGAENKGGHR